MARTAGGAMLDRLRGAPVAERIKVQVADFTPRATTGPAASLREVRGAAAQATPRS
jgi:hypothetical protein